KQYAYQRFWILVLLLFSSPYKSELCGTNRHSYRCRSLIQILIWKILLWMRNRLNLYNVTRLCYIPILKKKLRKILLILMRIYTICMIILMCFLILPMLPMIFHSIMKCTKIIIMLLQMKMLMLKLILL
ncbi:MAG: Alt protein, partial [Melanogrammus aeglefinus-associated papillomavirus 2]